MQLYSLFFERSFTYLGRHWRSWHGGSSEAGTESQSEVLLEDDVAKINALLLRPQTSSTSGGPGAKKSTKRPRVQQVSTKNSSSEEGHDVSVVYVCELPKVMGWFDIEKARKFFSRPGPHYGLLQSGKSVMSSDGITMGRSTEEYGGTQCSVQITFPVELKDERGALYKFYLQVAQDKKHASFALQTWPDRGHGWLNVKLGRT